MSRPNVVVVYCDDLGYGDLGCYGSEAMETPNVDALADEGVRFTDWYSNSPVCSPSRAALLTGRHPANAGVRSIVSGLRGTHGLDPEQPTLADRLSAAGYRTGAFGKWHLGTEMECGPNAHGFDEFFGFRAGCVDYYSHIFYWGMGESGSDSEHDLWEDEEEVWENGEYLTHLITDRTVEFVEESAADDDPFFAYVPYNAPHYPMHAPAEYLDRFPDLPPQRRIMAAMIAAVDDGVGDVVDALRRTDQYEDTVIIFSSDNGPSRESRNFLDGSSDPYYGGSSGGFRGHKFSLFEGGIRMPAIVSYPGEVEGGRVCEEVCAMMDVVPTCLDLCGVDADADVDGESLASLLREGEPSPRDHVCWEFGDQLAIREDDWKLVLNGREIEGDPDSLHLSNLADDESENRNLADQRPRVAERLESEVRAWYEAVTD